MFCSHCGRTVAEGAEKCACCGQKLRKCAFSAGSYIATLPAGETPAPDAAVSTNISYTRTTYSTRKENTSDVMRNTTYCVIPKGSTEPEEQPAEEEQQPQSAPATGQTGAPVQELPDIEIPDELRFRVVRKPGFEGMSDSMRERLRVMRSEKEAAEKNELPAGAEEPAADTPKKEQQPAVKPAARSDVKPDSESTEEEEEQPVTRRLLRIRRDKKEEPDETADTEAPEERPRGRVRREAPKPIRREEPEETTEEKEEEDDGDFDERRPSRFHLSTEGILSKFGRRKPQEEPEEEEDEDEEPEGKEEVEEEVEEQEINIENEPERGRKPLFSLKRKEKQTGKANIVRTVIVILIVLVLALGGFVLISLKSAARSPITGVTYTLYERTIATLEAHTTQSYRSEMEAIYGQDVTGTMLLNRQNADQAAMRAQLPGTPLSSDEAFLEAALTIQGNIDNAVTLDCLSSLIGSIDNEGSQERWNAIKTAIEDLKNAVSAGQFDSIAASSEVVVTPEPEPTPTVCPYTPLTKGMMNNEEVRKMQSRLYELGWFNDVRDGDFGAATQLAVQKFQNASGLPVTGIADVQTQEAMYAPDAIRTGTRVTPAPAQPEG